MPYPSLELVSHHLCPYVQRSIITLIEKNILHDRTYIDLSNKPEWFVEISPTGKVPLLKVEKVSVLFESAVICEFLDEITEGSLHPSSPLEKAVHRGWNEFASNILNDIGKLYNAGDASSFTEIIQVLEGKFLRLEKQVQAPYFAGDEFCMVDAAYGPVFRYFDVIDSFLSHDIFSKTPKVKQWRKNLGDRLSVKQAVTEDYPLLLRAFLIKRQCYISHLITGHPLMVE